MARFGTMGWFRGALILTGTLTLGASALGCSDDDSDPAGTSSGTQAKAAMLRVVHASADAPAVDLYVKGQSTPFAAALAYGAATPYVEVPEGPYEVEVRAAGAAADSAPVYTTPVIELAAGMAYSALAVGSLASTDETSMFRVLPLMDPMEPVSAGMARARIVHAGYDAPTVDLDVGNDDPSAPEVPGLARFAVTDAVELPAGVAYNVGIAVSGQRVTSFTTPPLTEGGDGFLIATGELARLSREEAGFSLLAVEADSSSGFIRQDPIVFAKHASPDAPAVDIYAGEAELVDNAAFGDMARLQVPPGSYTLDFFAGQAGATPRPAGDPAASAPTGALEAGAIYLAIATGELTASPSTFELLAFEEQFALDQSDQGLVRVVHASPDAPAVDIGPVTTPGTIDAAVIAGLAYRSATDAAGLALPPGSYVLGVTAAGDTATLFEFDLTLAAGDRYFAVAAGDPASSGASSFRLFAIDTTEASWPAAALLPRP